MKRQDRRRAALALGPLLAAGMGTACAAECGPGWPPVAVGMTRAQVRAKVGTPQRIGVLRGKDIERVAPEAEKRTRGRIAYFYRDGLTVWFEGPRVTGTMCGAPARGPRGDRAEDH
jgi:hypothetical protein